jgi:hypothetical protein
LAFAVGAASVAYLHLYRSPQTQASTPDAAPATNLTLDEEQKAYVWEIEHHGNVLSRTDYGFKAIGLALQRADAKGLAAFLAGDFRGDTLGKDRREVKVANRFAKAVRQQPGPGPRQPLDATGFVREMLRYRALFSKPPKVALALMALRPARDREVHGRWQGSCQLRMSGEMGRAHPGEVIVYLRYQIDEPQQENLLKKRWIHEAGIDQVQTAEAPHYLMHEVAAQRGLAVDRLYDNWKKSRSDVKPNTGGVYLCDFNRDGILDMLVTDINGIFLYQGQKDGTFRNVTTAMGLQETWGSDMGSSMVACFVDLDGDGWEDLILGDHIYRNEAGKRFVDYTLLCNLVLPRDAVSIIPADYDRDGKMDLYVTRPGKSRADSYLKDTSGEPEQGNALWRNKGNWRFENVTRQSGTAAGNRSTFSAVWLDANNDGWPDLYVINEFGNGVLLINRGDGTFEEHLLTHRPGDFGTMGVTCGDIDNDGYIDIYCANMYSKAGKRVIGNLRPDTYAPPVMDRLSTLVAGSQLWRNKGGLAFEPVGDVYQVRAVGWAYGAALVDLDNDGYLDLVATAGFVSQDPSEPDG